MLSVDLGAGGLRNTYQFKRLPSHHCSTTEISVFSCNSLPDVVETEDR